jgi:RNA polymerase sigma-70 factor (ECF subfamily)
MVGTQRPTAHADLARMSDAELIACAREWMDEGEAGAETARRCVALMFERHAPLVRAHCAKKAPLDVVDDLVGDVYVRFVRTVFLRTKPIENPVGLLVIMAKRVVASFHAGRRPGSAPLDEAPELGADEAGYERIAGTQFVEQLLSVLTDRQREVVRLRLWHHLPSAAIATRLGMTVANVDVTYFRAMDRLSKELER